MTDTTTELPTWEQMSELDRGAALMHVWKRHWEGTGYAIENYPCRYIEDPRLLDLTLDDACRHAQSVTGGWDNVNDRIGEDEVQRLYNRAHREGDEILDSRKMWGARHRNGNISPCDEESHARFLVMNPSWRCVELLHRTEVGGEWTVAFDARGLEQDCPVNWVRAGDLVLHGDEWVPTAGDCRTENAARGGGPEHNGLDVQAGHVSYVVDLAGGAQIRVPKTGHGSGPDLRIRRGAPEIDRKADR